MENFKQTFDSKYSVIDNKGAGQNCLASMEAYAIKPMLFMFLEGYGRSKFGRHFGTYKRKIEFDNNNINIIEPREGLTSCSIRGAAKGGFGFENGPNSFWIGFRSDLMVEPKFEELLKFLLCGFNTEKETSNGVDWHYFCFTSDEQIKKFLEI